MKKITLITLILSIILVFCIKTTMAQEKDYSTYPYWVDMMQDPDANFFETQKAFNQYWEGKEIIKGNGYKVFKRWEYWMSKQVSPDGTKPSAYRDIHAMQSLKTKNSTGTRAGSWVSLGPNNVPSGYNGYRGLGRINAVAFHPTDPNTVFAGAPAGGLWITYDDGATWVSHTDIMPTLGVSSIVVDYINPDIIYLGTGDRDAGDAPGLGVWKSLDGGVTFQPSNTGMEESTVGKLIIHPTDNNILIAATGGGIYRTTNAGASWTKIMNGNFKDIVFKPGDHNIVYAATAGNFYRSTNNGVSFTQVTNGLPGGARSAIGVSPANPEVVYLFVTNQDSFKGLYRSNDSGLSFSVMSTSPNIMAWDCNGGSGGQAWYDLDVAVDPTNADILYGGGVNCFKSINGGSTWAINSHWYGGCGVPSVHADLHVLEYNPLNNRLYAGNDGGLYWAANGGQSWTEISNGMVISQAYKIGQSATNKNYVINGYQDNGTSSYTGTSWVSVGGGDGMECAYDPTDDLYSYSTVYYGSITRNYNHNGQAGIAGQGVNGITESGAWVTPFIIDHYDGNTMFIGYDNIWRSTNIKASNPNSVKWDKISEINVNDLDIVRQSYANTNIIYTSKGNSLYRSDNVKASSVTWGNLTGLLPTGNTITAIETSPVDENVVYIVQQNRVFKSSTKGMSWTEITTNLPDVQMNTLVYYKNSPEGLYLGTNIGVFYRDASNEAWIHYSDGLPAAAKITELEIYYDPAGPQFDLLRAATYGRGLWESSLHYSVPFADFEADQVLVPLGCGVNFSDKSLGIPFQWEWQFEGGTPATSTERNPTSIVWNQPGTYTITLIVQNPAGTDTITKEAYINASGTLLPVAQFTSSLSSFCTNDEAVVSFYDQSDYCPTTWAWSFEPADVTFMENTTASSQNPVVQFNLGVPYSVTLVATNANGSANVVKQNYVVIGGQPMPFNEDFENADLEATGWTIVNPDNTITWDIFSIQNDTVVNKAARMNFFNYNVAPGRRDQLISPPINLDGFTTAYLGFEHAYIRRYAQISDTLIIYLSDDCGNTWTRIRTLSEDGTGTFETVPVSTVEYVPQSSDDWCNGEGGPACNVINISQWAGKNNIKIMFETFHKRGNNLFIDNIYITPTISTTSISTDISQELTIYPNPANRIFTLQSQKSISEPEVKIFNFSGKLVFHEKLATGNHWAINPGGLSRGVYMLRVISENGAWDEKLIIK